MCPVSFDIVLSVMNKLLTQLHALSDDKLKQLGQKLNVNPVYFDERYILVDLLKEAIEDQPTTSLETLL